MDKLFFVASKLGWVIASPGNLAVILLIFATIMLLLNKVTIAKWIFVPLMIITGFLMAYPFADGLVSPLETRFSKPISLPQHIDGIIILGGGEKLKQSLSWDTQELGDGGDRLIAGAILAKHYPETPIIYTGGSNLLRFQKGQNEANIAQKVLIDLGVADERLIVESESRNTAENFLFIKRKLPKADGDYLLITSAFHMPRSVGIARQQHINVIPYPVDYVSNKKEYRHWDFDFVEHLKTFDLAWHEWLGLTAYYWTGKTSEWFPQNTSE